VFKIITCIQTKSPVLTEIQHRTRVRYIEVILRKCHADYVNEMNLRDAYLIVMGWGLGGMKRLYCSNLYLSPLLFRYFISINTF
jgi:hypothetical protein